MPCKARIAAPRLSIVLGLGLALLLTGCSESPPPDEAPIAEEADKVREIPEALKSAVTEKTQAICDATGTLAEQVTRFLDAPGIDSLAAARESWRHAHQTYQQLTAVYQIADLSTPQRFNDRDPVDAHPMLPGYLDQVPNYPRSGLTCSEVPLTPEFLRKEHQSTDFYYLTLGFHPMESLLWPSGSRQAEATLANFQTTASEQDGDQINAPQRRTDLLRLIATALHRDTQSFCQPQNQAYLMTELAGLSESPTKAAVRLERTLANTVGDTLARWSQNPEGEDRNGMPVAHSPQAQSDFAEYSSVTSYLRNTWLPILLKDKEDALEEAQQSLETLESTLAAIDQSQKPLDQAALTEARAALTEFSEGLTELAFQDQAAEY